MSHYNLAELMPVTLNDCAPTELSEMFQNRAYQVEPMKNLFRIWFSSNSWPSETIGQTGDIFLSEHLGAVFWKKPYQEGGGRRWTVAFDRDVVVHPCEPDLRLIVQKDWQGKQFILWERLSVQTEGSFEDALPDMKESVLAGNATGMGTAACLMEID